MKQRALTNRSLGVIIATVFAGMIGMAYAAVPLYRMFCEATGYNGTVTQADGSPHPLGKRMMRVEFDANVGPGLDWSFAPETQSVEVRTGQVKTVYYKFTNNSDHTETARAVDNVAPLRAGQYAVKIQCFCDTIHTLKPHQTVELPLVFYLSRRLEASREMQGVNAVTFSYTLYENKGRALNG